MQLKISTWSRYSDWFCHLTGKALDAVCPLCLMLLLGFACSSSSAQFQAYYEGGRGASPAYEGWLKNDDGSFSMLFGYMSDNWKEELNVPIGPNNSFSPAPTDRGQPTRFLPRRNRYVFSIKIPADFGNQELVWTLITEGGQTQKAYGSLRKDYALGPITMMSEGGTVGGGGNNAEDVQTNKPPEIALEGTEVRTVLVGEPLQLVVTVADDDKPLPRGYRGSGFVNRDDAAFVEEETPRERFDKAMRPPQRGTVNRVVGAYFAWFLYRGDVDVTFDPLQARTWEDTRAFQNSPWSPFWVSPVVPEGGRYTTTATFNQPGTYVLRGRADDGGLVSDVEVTVHVNPR